MKVIFFLMLVFFALSCGNKSGNKKDHKVSQREEILGIGTKSECNRAKLLQGSNGVFQWVKAAPGDLQNFVIDMKGKKIIYQEATNNGFLGGASSYSYQSHVFYFKTKSKNLKLTFPVKPTGIIENDPLGKDYVVSVLTYHDGSGFQDAFLCPKI